MSSATQLLTFTLERQLLGVAVADVQEIVRELAVTPVPLAPPLVEGVVNLRGQVVPAFDLRGRLELPARADGAVPIHLVARTKDGAVSLLVDDVGDVVAVEPSRVQPTPATVAPSVRALARGVVPLDGRLLLVLDLERTLAIAPARTSS
jgi:purine-binding chemotaxis protein CheW